MIDWGVYAECCQCRLPRTQGERMADARGGPRYDKLRIPS